MARTRRPAPRPPKPRADEGAPTTSMPPVPGRYALLTGCGPPKTSSKRRCCGACSIRSVGDTAAGVVNARNINIDERAQRSGAPYRSVH